MVDPDDAPTHPIDAPPPIDSQVPVDARPDAAPDAPPDAPPDACVPLHTQLLANPVFDLEPPGTLWVQNPIPNLPGGPFNPITTPPIAADTTPYGVWLGGAAGEDASPEASFVTDSITQDILIPAETTELVISGKYLVGTTEDPGTGPFDSANVALLQTDGTPIDAGILSLTNLDGDAQITTWTPFTHSFNVTGLSGTTVRVRLTSTNDIINHTNFFFDSLSLQATSGCP